MIQRPPKGNSTPGLEYTVPRDTDFKTWIKQYGANTGAQFIKVTEDSKGLKGDILVPQSRDLFEQGRPEH